MDASESLFSALPTQRTRLRRHIGAMLGHWSVAFSLSCVCVVSGHLMIKAGLNAASVTHPGTGVTMHILHLLLQPRIVAGLAIYLFGTACWMIAVSQKEISFLYPLSSVNYVLVVIASALLLSEPVSLRRGEGVLLIVLGMLFLNRRPRVVCA